MNEQFISNSYYHTDVCCYLIAGYRCWFSKFVTCFKIIMYRVILSQLWLFLYHQAFPKFSNSLFYGAGDYCRIVMWYLSYLPASIRTRFNLEEFPNSLKLIIIVGYRKIEHVVNTGETYNVERDVQCSLHLTVTSSESGIWKIPYANLH